MANTRKESDIFCIKDIWTWFSEHNIFLNESNNHDYRVKLMKLTFFAVGFYKAYTGRHLVNETFEAWREGHVSNKAYAQIRQDDKSVEMDKFNDYPNVEKILNEINDIFGIYSAAALSQCSHLMDSWKQYYREDEYGNPIEHIEIPDDKLYKEFEDLIENLKYFYKFDSNKESACIIGDKTIIYNIDDEDAFELNYDKICDDVSDTNNFKDENLIFISFDKRVLHYEL